MASATGFPANFIATMIASAPLILAACRNCSKAFAAGVVCCLFSTNFAWAADETKGPEISDNKGEYSTHDYKARFRPAVWSVFVEGEFETVTSLGSDVSLTFDGDLGYDDPYPTFDGEASFRRGRHDFWITGMVFDQSESAPINVEFTVDGIDFNIGGIVDSEATITDINFTYGYSFFEFEEDGFRLGPTIALSYTDISVEMTELTIAGIPTGARFRYEDTFPIPTIGAHAEVPYGNFLFSTQLGGFYFDAGDWEATGVRAEAGVTWRPYGKVGFFAGLKAIYADLDLGDEKIDDLLLWGPAVGLEFRF
jgi:hypothetical protein